MYSMPSLRARVEVGRVGRVKGKGGEREWVKGQEEGRGGGEGSIEDLLGGQEGMELELVRGGRGGGRDSCRTGGEKRGLMVESIWNHLTKISRHELLRSI